MEKIKRGLDSFVAAWKSSKRSVLVVFVVLRVLVIGCLVRQIMNLNIPNVLLCFLTLLISNIPLFMKKNLKIQLPDVLEITIFIFVFAAEILGEISNFYGHIPFWDTMLHTTTGFFAASIGFGIINLLNGNVKNLRLTPLFVAIFVFCFSMTVGVCWEFIEFSFDHTLSLDMQKDRIVDRISTVMLDPEQDNHTVIVKGIDKTILYDREGNELATIEGGYLDVGIIDTMKDLFVNFIGAVVFAVFGYLYTYNSEKYKFAGKFVITKSDGDNADPGGENIPGSDREKEPVPEKVESAK